MHYSDFVKYKQYIELFEKQMKELDLTTSNIVAIAGDFGYISERHFRSYMYHWQGLKRFYNWITDRCYLVRVDEEN